MKVKAIVTISCMSEIFVKDDILELEVVRYEKDTELYPHRTKYDKDTKRVVEIYPAVIAKKGDYKHYVLILPDGRRYSESNMHDFVGYKPLKEMFEKIND